MVKYSTTMMAETLNDVLGRGTEVGRRDDSGSHGFVYPEESPVGVHGGGG